MHSHQRHTVLIKEKESAVSGYNLFCLVLWSALDYAMRTLSHCFTVCHVHDDLIIETPMDASLDAICEQMGRTPDWIEGLCLRADGYETPFYKKD